ncbi:hypothetical protein COLO4_28640 [Corchorus olitorius]|uniref:Polyprotein n=1 Tax=Corchorus olitorius TaxID=93759 RepID=A0A1R3HJ51_9ROSI|nr:hypothetical protein COLO4_28640 [Corchorus olitorius]
MTDELICEFEEYATAQGMWNALKEKFGNVFDTKLKQLVIKFDNFKKRPENNMRQHLQEMSDMMRELKIAGHVLNDQQQVQAVVRSLPRELEEERLMAMSNHPEIKMVQSSKRGGSSHKRKKVVRMSSKMTMLNHMLREPRQTSAREADVPERTETRVSYVTSSVMLTESQSLWTVDSAATDYVARSREAYVEYRRIPAGTLWMETKPL